MLDALVAPPAVAAPLAPRPAAIVMAAVFDAVNGIERRYTPVHVLPGAPPGASQRAAAVQAAYASLVRLFPSQAATFDAQRAVSLSGMPGGPAAEDSESIQRGNQQMAPTCPKSCNAAIQRPSGDHAGLKTRGRSLLDRIAHAISHERSATCCSGPALTGSGESWRAYGPNMNTDRWPGAPLCSLSRTRKPWQPIFARPLVSFPEYAPPRSQPTTACRESTSFGRACARRGSRRSRSV